MKLHIPLSVYKDKEKIMQTKRLFRSRTDMMLGGVCGGLAKYLTVDPAIVRLVFVLLFFIGGGGFWIYFVLWLITPVEPRVDPVKVVEVRSEKVESMPSDVKKEISAVAQVSSAKMPDDEKVKSGTKKTTSSAKKKPKTNDTASKIDKR
jgi:phage shock protein C